MRKKEMSKCDILFMGIVIGAVFMLILFVVQLEKEKDRCATNGHDYITRCTICGDILEQEEPNDKTKDNDSR